MCRFLYFYFLLLIFFSVTARIGHATDELRDAVIRGDLPCIGHVSGQLALLGVELALLRAVIGAIEKVFYFFYSTYILADHAM